MFNLKIPQSIFVHADGFLKASQSRVDPPNPYDAVVLVTNCAIACELYLKCLIYIETGQLVKNQHNLKRLFAMVPKETQSIIQERFDAQLAKQPAYDSSGASEEHLKAMRAAEEKLPKNLIEALRKGGDAFVQWRYLYEAGETMNAFALFPLPYILRDFILGLKPEWAKFQLSLVKVGTVQPTSRTP